MDGPRHAHGLLAQAIEKPTERAVASLGDGLPWGASSGGPQTSLDIHLRWMYRSLKQLPELADPAQPVLIVGNVAMVLATVDDRNRCKLLERMSETGGTRAGALDYAGQTGVGKSLRPEVTRR
ncbi:hypothetical protein AB0F52_30245 [Amycolatopsis sp. NPDC024027]|uniref:hypothetical protein n=1 Tax=Amycolatopsis sp. NPDC024027 TaxID=3154327 RepID=UPI0033F11E4A